MHIKKLWLIGGVVWACAGGVGHAAAQEDVLAVVAASDGSTELVLLADQVVFRFTEAGAGRIERQVLDRAGDDAVWSDGTIAASAARGIMGMRMAFPISDIRDVTYANGTLVLYFTSRPPEAAETDPRGKFEYHEVPESQARKFLEAFRRNSSRARAVAGSGPELRNRSTRWSMG